MAQLLSSAWRGPYRAALAAALLVAAAGCNPSIEAPPLADCPPEILDIEPSAPGTLLLTGLGLVDEHGPRGISVAIGSYQAEVLSSWSEGCAGCEACMVDALSSCTECRAVCDGEVGHVTRAAGIDIVFEAEACDMGFEAVIPPEVTWGDGPMTVTVFTARGASASASWAPPGAAHEPAP